MNISKVTFCNAIHDIQEQDKINHEVCDALGKVADIFSFNTNNLCLRALLDVLKEVTGDKDDYIGWWLWESVEKVVSTETKQWRIDTPADLYEFLVEDELDRQK